MLAFSAAAMFLLSSLTTKTIDTKDIVGAWGYGPAENRTVMLILTKYFLLQRMIFPEKNLSVRMVEPGEGMVTIWLKKLNGILWTVHR